MTERYTLYCEEAYARLLQMEPGSIGAVITDPPYSSGGQFRGDRMGQPSTKYQNSETKLEHPEFGGDNRDQRSYLAWCTLWLDACRRLCVPGAPVCLFCDWRQLPITTDAVQAGGWTWRGILVWDKTEGVRPQKGRFASQAEYMVWGSNGPMPTPPEDAPCLPGVLRKYMPPGERVHMVEKPVEIMDQIVRIATPGCIIIDPFMGSGSTGVSAVRAGYGFVGIEQSPAYFSIAQARLEHVVAGGSSRPVDHSQMSMFDLAEVVTP